VKFGKTLVLLAVFAGLLAFVLIFESKGKKAEERKAKEEKLVDLTPADILKIELKSGGETMSFDKDDKGEWRISGPLKAKADGAEVGALADNFASLKYERLVEADPKNLKTYGIPDKELSLWVKGTGQPVRLLFGMENPIDKTLFAQREGEKRVVLLASSLKSTLDKKLFDFREKAVFNLDTAKVGSVRVKSKAVSWEAVKKDDAWEIVEPVKALADKAKVDGLVTALSDLKAKEFVSETKSDEDMRKAGLDKPDFEVSLVLPDANSQPVFRLRAEGDKIYACDSLVNKIVLVEGQILTDLNRNPADYREKKVAAFNSWEADRIAVVRGSLNVSAVKEKVDNVDKWRLETPDKAPADGSKIETLIRKIESLETIEFIDTPKGLAEYGLEKPEAEIKVRTKDYEGKVREATILVGREDKDKKQVAVKNAALPYLMRVDGSFLQELPAAAKDWQPPAEAKSGDIKKAP
jgi:hypothetical protein